ncbi:MAG TPA: DUF92 domain-containing protein [Candidatus Angelobacter sp.]|nr:DUF92 domain-containing protein [Candidatus Angelobacter sp.]
MPPAVVAGSEREPHLERATKFKAADAVALAAGAAVTVIFFLSNGSRTEGKHLLLAAGITLAFALLGWLSRGVNASGAVAGAAVAFVLAARDLRMFWVLLLVFVITFLATRIGGPRKRQLSVSEAPEGRSASQVMANLGVAAFLTALIPVGWQLMALAALAEAAADTSSSEVGTAFPGRTVLLTSWKPVTPGADGGVSLSGTAAALIAAGAVGITANLFRLAGGHHALVIIYAGVLGMLVDSLLGALLERRGFLNNDAVNLLSTASAAVLARPFFGQSTPVALVMALVASQ